MGNIDGVCVVTQPIASASESHVEALMEILGAITAVSLVTANLPEDSPLHEQYEVQNVASVGTGQSIFVASLRFPRNQIRMAREIRRREEGTVLFFGAVSYVIPIIAAKLSGKRVILEPRGNVPLTLRLHWEQRMPTLAARTLAGSVWVLEAIGYRLADGIITYTPSMADELGLDRYEQKLYPNGARYIDTDQFSPRVPYEKREKTVGFLGRLDEEKRVRELAAVAKQLSDQITFVFAGDGELREWLETELSAEIESGSVEVTGWVDHDDVPDVLSRFNLLVLPSAPTEGLPTVILESMACGTPVYATPVSGVPDVVQEGDTGFLMEKVNPKRVSAEIEEILARNDIEQISDNGRNLTEKEYSFQGAVKRYTTILECISG